jgi:hypothetical protein
MAANEGDHTKAAWRCLMLLKHGRMRQMHELENASREAVSVPVPHHEEAGVGLRSAAAAESKKPP